MNKQTLKRIPSYFFAGGTSLVLGLLSFSGMFALASLWPLALGTLVLAVAYDYEIYQQNMDSAFNKLFFVRHYLTNHLAKEFLKKHFPMKDLNKEVDDRPEFFQQYEAQLLQLHEFEYQHLGKAAKKRKKSIEKNLQLLEDWFAHQLFLKRKTPKSHDTESNDAIEISQWLDELKKAGTNQLLRDEAQQTLKNRRRLFYVVGAFSVLSAGFMTLGTTYLLSETIALIPVVASISAAMPPAVFLVAALIAGIAYGFLTYNAVTDMINNQTIQKFIAKLLLIFTEGLTVRHALITLMNLSIIALAVGLTICTAGTWWTIAKETAPLFSWLLKLPDFIMGIINPIITGTSTLMFNIENSTETVELLEHIDKGPIQLIREKCSALKERFKVLPKQENWVQIVNPARLILKLTVTPLRILLFIGHIMSMAVIGDRVPGLSAIASTLFGLISEGFEDGHYFAGHQHHEDSHPPSVKHLVDGRLAAAHGHSHDDDFPTKVLKRCFFPIYKLATFWDWITSRLNPKVSSDDVGRKRLSYAEARDKQEGHHVHLHEHQPMNQAQAPLIDEHANRPLPHDTSSTSRPYRFFGEPSTETKMALAMSPGIYHGAK